MIKKIKYYKGMIACFIDGFKLGKKGEKLHNGISFANWYIDMEKSYKEYLKEVQGNEQKRN